MQVWGDDVDTFRPERWLNEEGQVRIVPEFLPFGLGMCLYNKFSNDSHLEDFNICSTDNICWLKR